MNGISVMRICEDGSFLWNGVKYVPERTCQIEPIKSGTRYLVSKYTCCGYELVDSLTDPHASSIPEGFCPNCGAKVVE